ncbi:hypothetical protein C2U55_12595 [Enterobacteriaceae bacterium ENNIH3]|nr:hypothetical protein C2U55_12595 [Enterobacteriaceae bacterium ENNIH3]AUV10089.1 hypothetical protein C2U52_29515 [Enterobacteriaceae bacterium ENNIH2]PTA97377.1 hypothetical protein C9415_00040 [Kluyvera sp. Nf5]
MIILLITIFICNSVLSRFGERVFHNHNAVFCGFSQDEPPSHLNGNGVPCFLPVWGWIAREYGKKSRKNNEKQNAFPDLVGQSGNLRRGFTRIRGRDDDQRDSQ